jgi:hypothetical protein
MWPKPELVDFFSNKNETMFGSGHENCPEFGVLGGVIFNTINAPKKGAQ